jgi:hypothetical protein
VDLYGLVNTYSCVVFVQLSGAVTSAAAGNSNLLDFLEDWGTFGNKLSDAVGCPQTEGRSMAVAE